MLTFNTRNIIPGEVDSEIKDKMFEDLEDACEYADLSKRGADCRDSVSKLLEECKLDKGEKYCIDLIRPLMTEHCDQLVENFGDEYVNWGPCDYKLFTTTAITTTTSVPTTTKSNSLVFILSAIGGNILFLIFGLAIYFWYRRRRAKNREGGTTGGTSTGTTVTGTTGTGGTTTKTTNKKNKTTTETTGGTAYY